MAISTLRLKSLKILFLITQLRFFKLNLSANVIPCCTAEILQFQKQKSTNRWYKFPSEFNLMVNLMLHWRFDDDDENRLHTYSRIPHPTQKNRLHLTVKMRKKRRDEGRMELIVMKLMIRFECCVFVVDLNSLAISYPRAEEQRGNIVILLYESLSNRMA